MGKSLKKFWQALESKNLAMPAIVVAFVVIATLAVVVQKSVLSPQKGQNFGSNGQHVDLRASYCPPDSLVTKCNELLGGLPNNVSDTTSPYYQDANSVAKLLKVGDNVRAARLEGQLEFYIPN